MLVDKHLNCAVDKTIDTNHTANTEYNNIYRIMLLMFFYYFLVPDFDNRPI